jgi:hypothetical protein
LKRKLKTGIKKNVRRIREIKMKMYKPRKIVILENENSQLRRQALQGEAGLFHRPFARITPVETPCQACHHFSS